MSHLTQSMVEQFFELEKESARGVLRKEMDSAMDTIFKQMKRKLMMLVDNVELGNETGHGLAYLGDQTDHEQQLYESSTQIPSTSTNSRTPYNSNSNQDDEIIVKNELGEIVNIIPNEPIPSSSSTQSKLSNERSNDNNDYLVDELDDDEDCDCPDCVGDLLVKNEEGGDQEDGDDSLLADDRIDESNDSDTRPTKRPRLEDDPVQDQASSNNQTTPNQIITISLKCPQCSKMFKVKDALNAHLKSAHSIQKYRCLYKDCNRSFNKQHHLTLHYSTAHPNQPNTTWPCGYCSGQFKNRKSLSTHHLMHHEEGLFQCAYPNCQFVGELKQTVHNHFLISHFVTKDFVCQFPGCEKRYPHHSDLKRHERTHLDVKPYRCKWPKCEHSGSAYRHVVMAHIRTHLKKLTKQRRRKNISPDPNDYLEVIQ